MIRSAKPTTIGLALAAAGYQDSAARLMALAIEAWAAHSTSAGVGARVSRVRDALRSELSWQLVEEFQPRVLTEAIEALLRKAAEQIAVQRDTRRGDVRVAPDGRGHTAGETQRNTAPTITNPEKPPGAAPDGGSGPSHHYPETQVIGARPAPALSQMADRQAAAMAAKVETIKRMSKLDTFIVNGQKIGDLTPKEAVAWASSRERDARFVRMLTANLPSDRPIRDFVSAVDADDLYARAQEDA